MHPIDVKLLFNGFVVIAQLSGCVLGDIPRPRGVAPGEASLYAVDETFHCFRSNVPIDSGRINDDYCDCPDDGSDEPGTSACANGRFHCENAGYRPERIPSSRVNDGICDCCDGSDEYTTATKCANVCSALGKEAKERERQLAELAKHGGILRLDMATKGKASKEEKSTRLAELEVSVQQAVTLKTERETIKVSVEQDEQAALDVYKKAAEEEKRARDEADELARQAEQERLQQQQQAEQYQQEEVAETGTEAPGAADHQAGEADELAGAHEDGQDEAAHDPDDLEMAELQTEDDAETYEEEEEETGEGHVEHAETQPEYDDETRRLIELANEARAQFDTAERELRQLESEKRQLEEQLAKDYGAEEEFAVLNGECFNFEDREYVYKLCPFDRAVQQPKNGGGETR